MNATRAFNVLTLTTIILLAGCFGATDSSATADEEEHTHAEPNAAPVLEVSLDFEDLDCSSATTCDTEIYYAAVDPDGDLMELGWDYNLDGTIDYLLTSYRDLSSVSIPIGEFVTLETSTVTEVLFSDCISPGTQTMTEYITTSTGARTTIALIAVDARDSATAILVTLDDFQEAVSTETSTVSCTVTVSYIFSDADAAGSMSDGGGDALVEITMTQGTDLNWAMLKITIKIDGGTPQSCGEAGDDTTCTWTPFEGSGNDQAWEVGEGITISEGSGDLCDGVDGGCSIQITITKKGTGSDADMVLAMVNAYADSSQ